MKKQHSLHQFRDAFRPESGFRIFLTCILFTGFASDDGYAGTMTFMEAEQMENGELQFYPMEPEK